MTFFSNPKRKNYVLNPRGKALYDDSNRFGTKMLEKMGWSKGKGLGANLDGQLDFIKVSHKSDQKGVGFKDRDDQWTSHESNFNSLLNSFKSTENSDEEQQDFVVKGFQNEDKIEKDEKKPEHFSGVSLEEQSKKSRARVHYKKFTRGKDLSRYSEKDLANIFGKKSLIPNADIAESKEEEEDSDESSKNTPNFGITTIETGTTINEYFKKKMNNSKNVSDKSSIPSTEMERIAESKVEQNSDETGTATNERVKKKKKNSKKSLDKSSIPTAEKEHIEESKELENLDESSKNILNSGIETVATTNEYSKKKKKKKNSNAKEELMDENKDEESLNNTIETSTTTNECLKKKMKNSKTPSDDIPVKSKKSKKDKKIESVDTSDVVMTPIEENENCPQPATDNVYEIRRYRAEVFRYVDLHAFPGSTLYDIPGYGYTSDMTLKIVEKGNESKLIHTLWNGALDKYANSNEKRKKKFVEHIGDLKKKNIFKI